MVFTFVPLGSSRRGERPAGHLIVVSDAENGENERSNALGYALSTSRKGPFPLYLSEIGTLAKRAHRLDILVDCLDYGSFFKPDVHQTVHDIVCEVAKTIEVRILVCGEVPQPLTEPSGRSLSKDELDTYCAALREDKGFSRFLEELAFPENVTFKTFETTWFKTPPPSGSLDACRRVCSPGSASLTAGAEDRRILETLLQIRQLWFARQLRHAGVLIYADPQGG